MTETDFTKNRVSVLMGIYNCASTLEAAVRSIQAQTYSDWELIMCDDGSTDDTLAVARKLAEEDDRIIVLRNMINRGLNYTLNKCLTFATGEFIARQDGDDESVSTRFEKQVQFLQKQSEYDIVSSPMIFFDESGEWGRGKSIQKPTAKDIVAGNPVCHAPVMMRCECIEKVGGYTVDKRMLRVEDVNLWIKLYAAGYRAFNLDEPLYRMRNDRNALNRRKYIYRINSAYVRLQGCRILQLGPVSYIKALKPMLNGLVPARLRQALRHRQWKSQN